jgi:hypothetical protein
VVLLVLDQRRCEAALEEAAAPAVALVEAPRVRAVEQVHAGGQLLARRLDEEVVVVVHEAAGVEPPAKTAGGEPNERDEVDPIEIDAEEELAARRSTRHVVEPVRQIASAHPRHDRRS